MPAALGLRAHSGWATLVAVGGSPRSPAVLDRRRIELADPAIPGSKQPYHAAVRLELARAEQLIQRCIESSSALAQRSLRAVIDELREKGHQVIGCGLLLGSGRPVPSVAQALASHPLMHTAEGQLFRNVLIQESERCGLPVTAVRERELYDRAAAQLHLPMETLVKLVTEMGRPIGPPWGQDEKQAAVAGWLAFSAAARR